MSQCSVASEQQWVDIDECLRNDRTGIKDFSSTPLVAAREEHLVNSEHSPSSERQASCGMV